MSQTLTTFIELAWDFEGLMHHHSNIDPLQHELSLRFMGVFSLLQQIYHHNKKEQQSAEIIKGRLLETGLKAKCAKGSSRMMLT